MKKTILNLCFCFILTSCVHSSTKILNYISNYVGQDVENVFSLLGYPDNESQFRDRKIYIWTNSNVQYIPTFQYNPYGLSTSGGSYVYGNCTIKVVTDRYGRIIDSAVQGNEDGCSIYARKLK